MFFIYFLYRDFFVSLKSFVIIVHWNEIIKTLSSHHTTIVQLELKKTLKSAQSFIISAFPLMYQSLLEMWESFTVGISQEVTALKESWWNIKVLCRRGSRRGWRAWIETRRAHSPKIIIVADRLLLAANLHFLVFLVSMLPMDLLELHRHLTEFLKRLPCQHHFLAVSQIAVKELLHHVHVINNECVKSLEISRWV